MSSVSRQPPRLRFGPLALVAASSVLAAVLIGCCLHPTIEAHKPQTHAPAGPRRLYAQTIVLPGAAAPDLQRAAGDLQTYLGRATGETFKVVPQGQEGVLLLRADAPETPADLAERARGCGSHGFVLRDAGARRLEIVSTSDAGLAFGAYHYLWSIGVRFYFPNERWTIVPQRRDLEQRMDVTVRPAFRLRQFVGTGGLGRGLAIDPTGELEKRWLAWKARNGFGEEFHIDGHSGEGFNVRHKQELTEHPEYLASVRGKRSAWSKTAKLDPTNAAAIDLFVRDRVEAYREKYARDPNGPGSFAVSVEPADGGGLCDSEECEEMGTASDREFFTANAVARALSQEFPGAKASLFAYNLHADVPNIAIEPNVYVTLVPYAFRRDGSDPEEFIKAWVQKKSPLSIYDYWSIPDWTSDLPTFDYRRTPAKKLRFWHAQGVEGFLGESTYGAGAVGLAWFAAARLMWKPDADVAALADEFFLGSFADAAPPMRRMLERWSDGFSLNRLELRASFADLREAYARTRDPAVRGRLNDYAGYLQYLRLRADWLDASAAEKSSRKRALVLHLWRIYESAMTDTYRLQQLLLRRDPELSAELNPTDASLPVWSNVEAVTDGVASTWIDDALRDFPDLGVRPRSYSGELVPLPATASPSDAAPTAIRLTLVGANRIWVHVPPTAPGFVVDTSASAPVTLSLLDSQQRVVHALRLPPADQPQRFEVLGLKPGDYALAVQAGKLTQTTLSTTTSCGFEVVDFRVPKAVPVPPLFFFVPKSESAVAIYDPIGLPAGSGASLRNASGAVVPLERYDAGRLLIARVPPGQRGRIWILDRAVSPDGSLRLLNVPQRLGLTPEALRVPSSALTAH